MKERQGFQITEITWHCRQRCGPPGTQSAFAVLSVPLLSEGKGHTQQLSMNQPVRHGGGSGESKTM